MKHDEFSEIVNGQIEECQSMLLTKGREYSAPDNKLHNFAVAAEMQGVSMRQALGGMMAKHTVSIYDMIQAPNDFSIVKWEEKITDHINYLLILKAVVAKEKQGNTPPSDEDASPRFPISTNVNGFLTANN